MLNKFSDVNKILVIKLRHIGDTLLIVPVLRALREKFPHAHISVLVNSGTEDVLIGNPLIDEIITFDRTIKKLPFFKRLIREISFYKTIRKKFFDMTVSLTTGDRAAIISFLSGAKYRISSTPGRGLWGKKFLYTHLSKKNKNHIVLQNLDIIRYHGIDTDNLSVDFFIPNESKERVEKIFNENKICKKDIVVHIHPTSKWLFKCWKDEYWAEVINWLTKQGIFIIITASPDKNEMDCVKNILSIVTSLYKSDSSKIINLAGKISIKDLSAISKFSDFFIGIDTAPMHIAAAVGTRVIALFGEDSNRWWPWGEGHIVISKHSVAKKGKQRKEYIMHNMQLIKPYDVIEKIKNFLATNINYK